MKMISLISLRTLPLHTLCTHTHARTRTPPGDTRLQVNVNVTRTGGGEAKREAPQSVQACACEAGAVIGGGPAGFICLVRPRLPVLGSRRVRDIPDKAHPSGAALITPLPPPSSQGSLFVLS